jgi:hypothetical protein
MQGHLHQRSISEKSRQPFADVSDLRLQLGLRVFQKSTNA